MIFAFYVAKLQKHFESSKMMLQKLHQKKGNTLFKHYLLCDHKGTRTSIFRTGI